MLNKYPVVIFIYYLLTTRIVTLFQRYGNLGRKETYCNRSAASYIPMASVVISSIARITSPEVIPALSAGPPGAAETTTSPAGPSTMVR